MAQAKRLLGVAAAGGHCGVLLGIVIAGVRAIRAVRSVSGFATGILNAQLAVTGALAGTDSGR